MNLDFHKLLAKTDLENKDCVEKRLNKFGIYTYNSLQNLPGTVRRPFFCGNPTGLVVSKLNEALKIVAEGVPSIEEVIPVAIEPEKPKKPAIVQETLLADIDLPGVHPSAIQKLQDAGFLTVGDTLKDQGTSLTEVSGIGDATKERIVSAVKAALEY